MTGGEEILQVTTRDGLVLTCSRFKAAQPGRVAILHSATGVRRRYYHRFCAYLAEQGISAYCYDYRGIGDSRPATLRGFQASFSLWAVKDAQAVFDHVRTHHPGEKIAMIGHSFGGQVLGLLEGVEQVDKALLVSAHLPSINTFPLRTRWAGYVLWRLLIPLLTTVLGYFPSSWVGMGEPLPAGVAREWAKWGLSPRYLLDHVGENLPDRFGQVGAEITALFISDDPLGPPLAVERLLEALRHAKIQRVHLTPAALGKGPIGHFGAFRGTFQEALWPTMAAAVR